MACVIFSVDGVRARGIKPVSNEEVAELAAENSDVMIPFASIDPASGAAGVREARRLIEHYGVKGFKFHPQFQEFFPERPRGVPAVRGDRGARAAGAVPHGPLGNGHGHAGWRRYQVEVRQSDARRRRRRRFSDDADRPRASVVAVAGRGAVDRAAQAAGLHRSLGLVAEVLSAAARAVREHAAQDAKCCSAPTIR